MVVSLGMASAQTTNDGDQNSDIPGDIIPTTPPGPVGVAIESKFDHGFYQKIQGLIQKDPQVGHVSIHNDTRYYNTIIVVVRDEGDGIGSDEVAGKNKDAVVKMLELVGARNIVSAQSLSFVTASIPVEEIPGLSLHDEMYRLGGLSPNSHQAATT